MIMWYAWSPAAQLGQSLNLMHKENHAPQSYALREVLLYCPKIRDKLLM